METTDETINFFRAIPQCAALLNEPGVRIRGRKPRSKLNPLMDVTLRHNEGLIKKMYFDQRDHFPNGEIRPRGCEFLQLGPGVVGQPGIAHGGFQSTLMDHLTGTLIGLSGLDEGRGMFTLNLNVSYHKPLFVPAVVIAKAWLDRVEGRKMYIRASIEDLQGDICTTADALFIKKRVEKV